MKLYHAKRSDIEQALMDINRMHYQGNIIFKRCDNMGSYWNVTLKVKDSHGPGGRITVGSLYEDKTRHICAACWHAHGYFMDRLLVWNPDVRIVTRGTTYTGEWEDWNAGSNYRPAYMSDLCECERG